MSETRKIAAILFTDVVGYSRLTATDEDRILARLRALRSDLIDPTIAVHQGRIVKRTGDGALVEFRSVVEAVRCAIEVQSGMIDRNAGLSPENRIELRIGIHLGDVVEESDGDLMGDGVNIAARLEGIATPGTIFLSEDAYRQVKSRLDPEVTDLGKIKLKNIADPVRVYSLQVGTAVRHGPAPPVVAAAIPVIAKVRNRLETGKWQVAAAAALIVVLLLGIAVWLHSKPANVDGASVARMELPLPDKPSIVVLPFNNLSSDSGQDFFADGITEDLITELSKVSELFVIARNTSFTYKGKPTKIATVAEELGVQYVLEGSVQRAGDQIRINAQLIDALNGGHVWADRFDGSLDDVFALQDKVTESTADALSVKLTPAQQAVIGQRETNVPAAYDQFLRGWGHYRRTSPKDYAKAIPYFEDAIRLDPNYYRAYAALALVYVSSSARVWTKSLGISRNESRARAQQYLKKAQRNPSALTYQVAGSIYLQRGQFPEASAEFKQAITHDPNDSWGYALASFALTVSGKPDEGLKFVNTAMRLDPHPPPVFLYYSGFAKFALEQFDDAVVLLERASRFNPNDQYTFLVLGAAQAYLGRKQDAMKAIARYNQLEVHQGGLPVTLYEAAHMNSCLCKPNSTELANLFVKGLQMIDVPETLLRGKFVEENRIPENETRSLLFGRRLHGRSLMTGEERAGYLNNDGAAEFTGDWVSATADSNTGISYFKDDELCVELGAGTYCGPVLRNPGGTMQNENEFIWRGHAFSPL